MAVTTETSASTYTGDGINDKFDTGFVFLDNDEVVVKLTPIATGVEVVKTEGTHYTLTGAGDPAGGVVTMLSVPANGDIVLVERTVPFTQPTAFRTQGTFSPEVHEDQFDEVVFQAQQLDRRVKALESAGAPGSVVAGNGLSFSGATLHVGAGGGIIANPDTVEVDYGVVGLMASVTKASAATGTEDGLARIDHKHDVSTAAPAAGAVAVGNTASEGTASSLARSDHQHAVTAGTPVNVTKAANAAGAAATFARSDHKHDITTAAAVTLTDSSNAEGSATSLARSDHTHSHGARGGGTLHAEATDSVAGFMPAADKAVLSGHLEAKSHVWAYQLAAQSIPHFTSTPIIFGTEAHDADNEYNPADGIFTAAKAGYILVCASLTLASAAWLTTSVVALSIVHNSNSEAIAPDYIDAAVTRIAHMAVSKVVKVAIGDTIRIYAIHNQGAAVNTGGAEDTCWATFDRII